MNMAETVLITGANNYVAQHIINVLLKNSNYNVIGTVRSNEKAVKLSENFNSDRLKCEVVSDMGSQNAFDEVFSKYYTKITHVIHTASPVNFQATDYYSEVINPAVEGMKSLLNSIKRYSSYLVKRVVVLSSYPALIPMADDTKAGLKINEESWNPFETGDPIHSPQEAYAASKTLAEKAAWKFMEENTSVQFELTTIQPAFIWGPQVFFSEAKKRTPGSCEFFTQIIESKVDDAIDKSVSYPVVDVRDVAQAHLLALKKANLGGKRLILYAGRCNNQILADTINAHFDELRGRIARGDQGSGEALITNAATLNDTKSKELLGFQFRSISETIIDTTTQILKSRN